MWFVLSIVLLLLTLTLVMSFTAAQTKVAKYAVDWVNDKYDVNIEVSRVRYIFPDELVLSEVYLEDSYADTLIYASQIDLHVHGFNSLTKTAYSNGVVLENLKFYWVKHEGDSIYNFQRFTNSFKSGDTSQGTPFNLQIADIEVNNAAYRYEDLNCPSCFRFWLHDLNIGADDFDLQGQYLTLNVERLSGQDQYTVDIKELETHFEYQPNHISLDNLEFTTGASTFRGGLVLKYDEIADFRDFVNQVTMEGEIVESDLNSTEIQYWGKPFPDFGQFSISGSVDGVVNDMVIKNVVLDMGQSTHLKMNGDLNLRNTTLLDQLFVHAEGLDLQSDVEDAQLVYGLFTDTLLPKELIPLGKIDLKGNFNGYLNNFTSDGILKTDLGNVTTSFYLYTPEGDGLTQYKGDVKLDQFDIGKITNEDKLGLLSTDMFLDGMGFDPTTMSTKLYGDVSIIQYNGYNYQNISIDGDVSSGTFNGDLEVRDPNLELGFSGTAGFEEDTSKYNFTMNIARADLYALNLVPEKDTISVVSGEVDIDFVALNYNKWAGDIRVHNSTYESSKAFHFFQDIEIRAVGLEEKRNLQLRSNILDADLSGSYSFSGIVDAMGAQLSRFVKTMDVVAPPTDQEFEFAINIKNAQILTDILINDLFVEQGSSLKGDYSSDSNAFNLEMLSPQLDYNDLKVRNIDLNFHGSPNRSQLGFSVGKLNYNQVYIDSVNLGNFYYNDTLFYDLRYVLRDSIDSRTNLLGYAIQDDINTFKLGIFESKFNISLQEFKISDGNEILLDSSGIHIQNLVVRDGDKAIYINGNISDNPNEILRLNLEGFGMDILNYFIGSNSARFKGDLAGSVLLTELLSKPKFAADLRIDSLEMNNTLLGNFGLTSDWAVNNDTIKIKSNLVLGSRTTFRGNGFYQPDSLGTISFDLDFSRFRLAAFDPFLEGIAENVRGNTSGNVEIKGTTGAPEVNGELTLNKVGFKIGFLQTDYNFVGIPKVKITPSAISFPGLQLKDTKFRTSGEVIGAIDHKNFRDFNLDLHIKARELLVLNTTAKNEDLYYGTAFVTGDINIEGPTDEILISADVISARNTKLFLPIDGATEVGETGFITFVDHSPELQNSLQPEEPQFNLNKGVTIDFNIEVDQNADVAIIVDSDIGNQLESRGLGNIRLIMKPYSDLEMYGSYNVIEGYYNFVLPVLSQNLITRKFDVLRGGSVTWDGDPLGALISLTARYTTKADPGQLISGLYSGGATLTNLDLYLSGELMDPEIGFDISAPRAPSTVQSAISNQLSNQDNLYTQVFSILALNRFAAPEGLNFTGAGRSLGFSALANQAASYINLLTDGDYQISLDYQITQEFQTAGTTIENSETEQKEVEVGVSKRFLDNRFTVSTSLGVAVDKKPDQRQFASDVEVEYNISEDGRFRAKAFNRPVQDQYNFGQQNYQQGVGVFYRHDFNKISNLWKREGKKVGVKEEDDDLSKEAKVFGPPKPKNENKAP